MISACSGMGYQPNQPEPAKESPTPLVVEYKFSGNWRGELWRIRDTELEVTCYFVRPQLRYGTAISCMKDPR